MNVKEELNELARLRARIEGLERLNASVSESRSFWKELALKATSETASLKADKLRVDWLDGQSLREGMHFRDFPQKDNPNIRDMLVFLKNGSCRVVVAESYRELVDKGMEVAND